MLLLLGMSLAWPIPVRAQDAVMPTAPVGFVFTIQGPEELAAWLQSNLTLNQFRQLQDLTDAELTRLVDDANVQARELLATRGYFDPLLQWTLETPAATAGVAKILPIPTVILSVQPGLQARVSKVLITFAGEIAQRADRQLLQADVQAQWLLPEGQGFTQSTWSAAKIQAVKHLAEQWYPLAQVTDSQAVVDKTTHQVSLSITLDSGPSVTLGTIQVTGADRYGAEQVLRLAQLTEGRAYKRSDLLQAQQRLVASGFYDSVFVTLDTEAAPPALPVKIELRETQRQKWVVGLGYRSNAGTRFTAEHTNHSLPYLHWRSVTKLSVDPNLQSLGVDLIGPPDADAWRWSSAAKADHQNFVGYAVSSQQWRAGRLQRTEVIDRNLYLQYDTSHTLGLQSDIRESLSANFAWTWRHFDGLPFPVRGLGFVAEMGPGVTLGDQRQPYLRGVARTLYLLPVGTNGSRLSLRGELGGVFTRDVSGLPTTQLFTAGGDNSVRGYAPNSLGVVQSGGVVAPGRYLASGSVEWQRPIDVQQRRTEWESVVFLDAAAVANTAQALQPHVGVGVGARWRSPLGPLQMDVAYALDTHRLRLHLSVGFLFR
jgi:translocation and assembly module TamA